MTGLHKPGRAFFGSFAAICALAAPFPLAAQNGGAATANAVAQEVAENAGEEVRSLNTRDLGPLEGAGGLGVAAPMSEIADFGVAWPDMSQVGDTMVGEAAGNVSIDTEQRYAVILRGIDDIEAEDGIREQFDALSVLREGEGDRAVVAQIERRADADELLMQNVMRSNGYYDAQVAVDLTGETGAERVEVVFEIDPGPRYRFSRVELPGLAAAGDRTEELREQFPVEEEDAVDAGTVSAAQANLAIELGNRGYPFAEVGEEEVVVDHANALATITLPVSPGGERNFGAIEVTEGGEEIFGADHVATIARFEPGELYSTAMVDDLRRALIQTGLVSRVDLTPVDPGDDATVDIAVAMQPAPPRTIAGEIGYGTGEGVRVAGSWEHRNFFPPEGALNLRGVIGTQEQFAGVSLRRGNFTARDHILTAQIFASNLNRSAYDARTAGFTAGFARVTNQLWQKQWVWSVGAELLASDERDALHAARRTFLIGALPLGFGYDGTQDLLNPESGFRFGALLSPEVSLQDQVFGYARIQLDSSVYVPVAASTTLAGRIRLGTIVGASRDQIAPSRRFYAGGGGSVRGYSYQAIGPRDLNNDPIGGRALFEAALEARYRFGVFGVVPFIDVGSLDTTLYPDFSDLRFGAGIGVRYYSAFGPIRIDLATPLNPQPGDPIIGVYVSLGQAF